MNLLICPKCGSRFEEKTTEQIGTSLLYLSCLDHEHVYPIRNGIPRFVETDNYAESFGFQWMKFSQIQLDSHNGTRSSEDRFERITGWTRKDLAGKLVLDAGCGAGRFSEIALKYGADLVAFDLSEAVDVSRTNLSQFSPFLCQASIYELPFPHHGFDYVYCIGVVQHTPDPSGAIRSLCRMVKPGGKIGLWIYERDWKSYFGTLGFKYALRPIFSLLPRGQQYAICTAMVNLFFPLVNFCKPLGLVGKLMMRLLPVASAHVQSVPLIPEDLKKWVLLDTFDMYSPSYDSPQTYSKVKELLIQEGFSHIERHPHGGIAVTAVYEG